MNHNYLIQVVIFTLLHLSAGRIHELNINGDSRRSFHIESFGFNVNGVAELSIKSFGIAPLPDKEAGWHMGLVFRKVSSESDAIASVEESIETGKCLLDDSKDAEKALADVRWEAPSDSKEWAAGWKHTHTIKPGEEGMYQIIFSRCTPSDAATTVSFDINLDLYNVKGNSKDYLSAGESALPLLYFAAAFTFAVMGGMWIYMCRNSKEFVHHIHLLMLTLIGLKMMSSLFHGISYHFVKMYGHPVGWQIIYYIFTFLKGIMFFSVIMLVGTGWSLLKVGSLMMYLFMCHA
jgi:G protein-coupled receptor 107